MEQIECSVPDLEALAEPSNPKRVGVRGYRAPVRGRDAVKLKPNICTS